MIYVIESVRDHDGTVHERELRRKGHRVSIDNVKVTYPLQAVYVDDGGLILTTSRIRSKEIEGDVLTVTTRNTVYTFRKEVTQSAAE